MTSKPDALPIKRSKRREPASMSDDPNKVRNDPMVPEYWQLGEDLQDRILSAGYESPTVEGIAVDVHDLLQASARIQEVLIPGILAAKNPAEQLELIDELRYEFRHIAWHCGSADTFLTAVLDFLPAKV
ncbi:MAG: hypothetical protein P4L46_19370 [Fimbriimonas sp.]|nr:hypothetical protein [Fimbriimonas sp.]